MSKHKGQLSIFNDSNNGIDLVDNSVYVELKTIIRYQQKVSKNNVNYYYETFKMIIDKKDKKANFFLIFNQYEMLYYLMRNNLKRNYEKRTSIYLKQIKNNAICICEDITKIAIFLQKCSFNLLKFVKKVLK